MKLIIPVSWKTEQTYAINNDQMMPSRKVLVIIAEFLPERALYPRPHISFVFRFTTYIGNRTLTT